MLVLSSCDDIFDIPISPERISNSALLNKASTSLMYLPHLSISSIFNLNKSEIFVISLIRL